MARRTLWFAVGYALAVVLGRWWATDHVAQVATVWPAVGVAVWWALRVRSRAELAVSLLIIAAIVTPVLSLGGFTPPAVALFAVAAVTVPVVARLLADLSLRESPFTSAGPPAASRLATTMDSSRFAVISVVCAVLNAFLSTLAVAVQGAQPGVEVLVVQVVRNAAAILMVAGMGLMLFAEDDDDRRPDWVLVASGWLATGLIAALVYAIGPGMPLGVGLLLPLIWAAIVEPRWCAALHAVLTATLTTVLVIVLGSYPFGLSLTPDAVDTQVQLFFVLLAAMALLISTAQHDARAATRARARSEQDALAAAEEMATITATVPDALIVADSHGHHRPLNASALALLDPVHAEERGLNRPLTLDLHDRDRAGLPAARALRGQSVRDDVVVYVAPRTGDRLVYEVSASPLPRPAEGREALVLLRDVTARFEATEELRRTRDHAVRLFADAPHGVAVVDSDGIIEEHNESFRMLLHSGVSLVGARLCEQTSQDEPQVQQLLDQALAADESVSDDITFPTRDDGEVQLELTVSRLAVPGARGTTQLLVYAVDVSERHDFEQSLAFLAEHDTLTSLLNRYGFELALAEHIDAYQRFGRDSALLVMDLDHFKAVNDLLGHAAGDQLLADIAEMLTATLRRGDLVARLGGDEFAILLPGRTLADAGTVAGLIIERIGHLTSVTHGEQRRITASIGVVTLAAAETAGAEALTLADALMYRAKEDGRSTYALVDDSTSVEPRFVADAAMLRRLELALEHGRLELHLQPMLDLSTDRIVGAEALVRLRDEGGLVMPGGFMPIAERHGLSGQVDAWVVGEAARLAVELQRLRPGFQLSCNVAATSIGSDLYEEALDHAFELGAPSDGTFVLEITETAQVKSMRRARDFAGRLVARGAKLALDDFGSGYGGLSYLKNLPFSYLKIDGSFVRQLPSSTVDQAIVRTLVSLARETGQLTVAEHVMDHAVLSAVRGFGVDYAQGAVIGRPVPVGEFIATHLSGVDERE